MNYFKQEQLETLIQKANPYTQKGKVADYIPALAKANPNTLALSICNGNETISAGNDTERFTLQSVSKIVSLALALMDHGQEHVFTKVGMEPTGDPFNSISKLETQVPSKPLNPMINAGALAVTNLIKGNSNEEKLERLLNLIRDLTGSSTITYNKEVAKSELQTADLNRSLSYFLRQHNIVNGDIEELMDLYTKQCAIEVNSKELARIGYILGNRGIDPSNGKSIIPFDVTRIVKTFMVTCGMYNASGEFAIKVGIPAKSGVSGAILGAIPYGIGIGVYSPTLDEKGNSTAGLKLLELLTEEYNLSIF